MREARISLGDAEFEALEIDELVTLCRTAGILDFEELVCRGTGAVVQVEVETRLDEDRLEALEYVTDWEHTATADDTHLYVVAFTAPALSADVADHMDELVGTCEPDVGERGATLSLIGSQAAIADALSGYQADGVFPDLRKLGRYEGRERPLDRLTERQREVIQTAFDLGYYEVPRAASTAAVADELDLDSSTVAEHLQRAERNLLTVHLSTE